MQPQTQYARSGKLHIAYQVIGEGPLDLVLVDQWFSNVDAQWQFPPLARMLARLASFSRLIVFDKRGSGLSDPVAVEALGTIEEWIDEMRAVLDAAGSERTALLSGIGASIMALLFGATYPERTSALVLVDPVPRAIGSPPQGRTGTRSWMRYRATLTNPPSHHSRGPAVRARASMSKPEPLYLRWRGKDVRIRHDDPLLSLYSAVVQRLQSAMTIPTEVATLRLVMARKRAYDVQVLDDGSGGGCCGARLRDGRLAAGLTCRDGVADSVIVERVVDDETPIHLGRPWVRPPTHRKLDRP